MQKKDYERGFFVYAPDFVETYVRVEFVRGDDSKIASVTACFCYFDCGETVAFIMDCLCDENEIGYIDRVAVSWTENGWVYVPRDRVAHARTSHGERMRRFCGFVDGDTVRGDDLLVEEVIDLGSE